MLGFGTFSEALITETFCCKLRSFLFLALVAEPVAMNTTMHVSSMMASSLSSASSAESSIQIEPFIRDYHAYMDIWNPIIGEELQLKREAENIRDGCAVAVVKDSCIVGHVPRQLSPVIFHFLARSCNRGIAEITGNKVNHGAGYGLKVPCIFRFYGTSKYLERLQKLLNKIN